MNRQTITTTQITEVIKRAYNQYCDETEGENANYIPYLANINPKLFGISATLTTGRTISVGDCETIFGIESISKVHTALLAIKQHGAENILNMIGADATGLPFNSIMALLLEKNHPSTPLVNAGAISACSLIKPTGNSIEKWQAIVDNITALSGTPPTLIDELYQSESNTNYNNRSITWLLKEYNRIYDNPETSLDLYTRQCSLGVTANQLSIAASTLANRGINPITKNRVCSQPDAAKVTSLMATVGFYETTGDWLYQSGLPAKSGVGGGIMGVLPGIMGIATFSPPLDNHGNSIRGARAIKYIMESLNLNIFNNIPTTIVDDIK